ncbi:DUF523 domain-containing protein [Marinifilum sp. N1E240]|uniref:DUF523 domain-containing protein n=1 Tax=Marinifilum sp. N1E240 TaxID=2608082 RepID=UPI00128E352C|nr:DUF523 domain-containing protein [Marinifilum sp. N1E240]
MIIVSACLVGINCRYDGNDNLIPEIKELVLSGNAIALCPEELGGLPTPRVSCEICKGKVVSKLNDDVTAAFQVGAEKVLAIAKILDTKTAILKSNSPSCGYGMIYDGTFSGQKITGNGLTAELLASNGIQIKNETNFKE